MTVSAISARDRLLLAFANLASYGIVARPSLEGAIADIREQLARDIRREHPHALGSYVFWSQDDDAAFSANGDFAVGSALPLHYSGGEVLSALRAACADTGIEIQRSSIEGTLLARDGGGSTDARASINPMT